MCQKDPEGFIERRETMHRKSEIIAICGKSLGNLEIIFELAKRQKMGSLKYFVYHQNVTYMFVVMKFGLDDGWAFHKAIRRFLFLEQSQINEVPL
jgi:hypothetical protein